MTATQRQSSRPAQAAAEEPPDTTLEQDFVAALHAHFRREGAAKIEQLAADPVAYLRLIAGVRDRATNEDPIDRMTKEELKYEIARIEKRIAASEKEAQIPKGLRSH